MKVGDQVRVPPRGQPTSRNWVTAEVIELERQRTIRDPADGSTRQYQKLWVRYDDGETGDWDRFWIEPRQSTH